MAVKEIGIRISEQVVVAGPSKTTKQRKSWKLFHFRRLRKKQIRRLLIASNIGFVLVLGASLYLFSNNGPTASISASVPTLGETAKENPLDAVSSADVAVNIARVSHLDEGVAVANAADTLNYQAAVSSNDNVVISKPQVVSGSLKSKKDIQHYVTTSGETVSMVATKFGVTSDTIRLSNGLTAEIIPAGKDIVISPINGMIYSVKAGDTPESLATRYRVSRDQLVAFNDAELTNSFKVGETIVIPDATGEVQAPTGGGRNIGLATANAGFAFGDGPVFGAGGNGYAFGYCTYWVALRRAQVGMPIPSNLGNASSWKALAARAGFGTGDVPRQNAVIWFPVGGAGHVGFVESVNPDGSANISEMNRAGWNRVSHQTIPASEVGKYGYIY
ncbi:hypothetical protein A3F37_00025 [Candidatus Saccharibacteria bacterium RIFCSPHIGHO2_12_FULL_41_12]|nr:MAG: hypothetical protein A3F37_00025 [Candidatus Saccharibacteria bacterium RIFCSPHIGHO2_12_FULL_41_12]